MAERHPELKAAEDSRTPGSFAFLWAHRDSARFLECGCPLPLWIKDVWSHRQTSDTRWPLSCLTFRARPLLSRCLNP